MGAPLHFCLRLRREAIIRLVVTELKAIGPFKIVRLELTLLLNILESEWHLQYIFNHQNIPRSVNQSEFNLDEFYNNNLKLIKGNTLLMFSQSLTVITMVRLWIHGLPGPGTDRSEIIRDFQILLNLDRWIWIGAAFRTVIKSIFDRGPGQSGFSKMNLFLARS